MAKLEYTFKTDTMFKLLFVRHRDLLKQFVAELMGIDHDSIGHFEITNSEMPGEAIKGKFCRLDINMEIDGERVNLEVQVENEGNYPERAMFHWARLYSSALPKGEDYGKLPRSVVISLIDFNLFDCKQFHSEFRALEVSRGEQLTDKMSLHFFELKKVPAGDLDPGDMLLLWLSLFRAETEEELEKIKATEVPVMEQMIDAYNQIAASPEFLELERLRQRAREDEANALSTAEKKGRAVERMIWQSVVAGKDVENERLRAENAELRAKLNG